MYECSVLKLHYVLQHFAMSIGFFYFVTEYSVRFHVGERVGWGLGERLRACLRVRVRVGA